MAVSHGPEGNPVLSVAGLCLALPPPEHRRGGAPVAIVSDLSFALFPGEVLGLAGESGAGKSLTAAALIGLLPPPVYRAAGAVHLQGRRIDGLPERQMRPLRGAAIGFIPQDPPAGLNPLERIGLHLVETIRTHERLSRRAAAARGRDLLARAGLPDPAGLMDAWPHQLSGGMRQRVAIALALAAGPAVLIADEPTTAVDVSIQAQVLALLREECRERGTAMLLITHDLAVMAETADRLLVLYAGREVESGPARALIAEPAHPYTRALLAALPDLWTARRRLPQIPGLMPEPGARPPGCAFHPRCDYAMPACAAEPPPGRADFGARAVTCRLFDPDLATTLRRESAHG
ncbi:MAG: ATP-binding cassette domain-containing protein [Alphaproteobacteria bacterium]|nr:ATP-binding cassette domain-containing protein [Alphaproteobacteria bacterium]